MKKFYLILIVAFLAFSETVFSQSTENSIEVLYFKANLACCKARACNALQTDVDSILIKYFSDKNIKFKTIKLADTSNKALITKYQAKSQTVVIVKRTEDKEEFIDLSAIVKEYAREQNKMKFESEMKKKINEIVN